MRGGNFGFFGRRSGWRRGGAKRRQGKAKRASRTIIGYTAHVVLKIQRQSPTPIARGGDFGFYGEGENIAGTRDQMTQEGAARSVRAHFRGPSVCARRSPRPIVYPDREGWRFRVFEGGHCGDWGPGDGGEGRGKSLKRRAYAWRMRSSKLKANHPPQLQGMGDACFEREDTMAGNWDQTESGEGAGRT